MRGGARTASSPAARSPRRRALGQRLGFALLGLASLVVVAPILFVVVTSAIWALSYFTQAFIIAGPEGGRESSMLFLAVYLYANAFQYLKMGYASAMAWALFIMNAVMTAVMLRVSRERVYYS